MDKDTISVEIADGSRLLNEFKESLGGALCQSNAAALAVLAAHLVQHYEEENAAQFASRTVPRETDEPPMYAKEIVDFWRDMEQLAVESIQCNDGKVVHWIGRAAKQMNPLLS